MSNWIGFKDTESDAGLGLGFKCWELAIKDWRFGWVPKLGLVISIWYQVFGIVDWKPMIGIGIRIGN